MIVRHWLTAWIVIASLTSAQGAKGDAKKVNPFDLLRDRDYARALEEFRRENTLYPRNAALLDGMAWCEFFLGRYDKAEDGFREALKYDQAYRWSKDGLAAVAAVRKAPLDEAKAALDAGRPVDAEVLYERIVEGKTAAPKTVYAEAWAGDGWALYQLGRYEDALKAFNQALKERRNFADAYRGIGYCEYARGRYTEAQTALTMSFSSEPNNYLAQLTVGWCLYNKKDWKEALRAFTKAGDQVAGAWGAWVGAAWCQERMERQADARAAFEKALETSPSPLESVDLQKLIAGRNDWWALYTAGGWSALRLHSDSAAAGWFQTALKLNQDDADATLGLAFAQFRLKDYANALFLVQKVASAATPPKPARFPVTLPSGRVADVLSDGATLRSWCKLQLGSHTEALEGFHQVLTNHPDWVDAQCGVGWTLIAKADYLAAEKAFADADKMLPGYPDAATGAAAVMAWRTADYDGAWKLIAAGEYAEAAKTLRQILEQPDTRFPKERLHLVHASIGWAELDAGNFDAAKVAFDKAVALNPTSGLAYKGLGQLATTRSDRVAAITAFQLARKDPAFKSDPDVLVPLGNAQLLEKQQDAAKAIFTEALATNPRSAAATAGLGWAHLMNNDIIDARVTFDRAIALQPELVDTKELREEMKQKDELYKLHGSFGWAWFNHGQYDKAQADFEAALKLDAREREHTRGMGLTLLRKNNLKDAGDHLRRYFAQAPAKENPWGILSSTLSEWAWALYGAQKYGDAAEVFNRLAALHVGEKVQYADPHDGLGWSYLRQGRAEQARAEFLKAIVINPRYESSVKGLEAMKDQDHDD